MSIQAHVDEINWDLVKGWAIDWDRPATPLEVVIAVDGLPVARCTADIERSGLRAALGAPATGFHEFEHHFSPPLGRHANHTVEVVAGTPEALLPNGRRTLFRPLPSPSSFTPILLSSCGRSGSTMLMRDFAGHPDIAVSNIYPFEVKLTSYYAAALNVLTASGYLLSDTELDFPTHASRDCLIGRNPWNRTDVLAAIGGTATTRLIRETFPARLADLFRYTIEQYYAVIASSESPPPRFFAEKSPVDEATRQGCRMLFGTVREIVLLRDPRDYLCSARAYWKLPADHLMTTMQGEQAALMRLFQSAQADVRFVRYEDLILNRPSARASIFDFIGCDPDATASHSVDAVPSSHRTSRSDAASIGRFETDLEPCLRRKCEDMSRPFMDMFDYRCSK